MPNGPFSTRAIPPGATLRAWSARDGWAVRRFDWPAEGAARGAILFQGGRGDFIEKYLEYLGHLHTRGWHVAAFDWRGQGGSGRLSANPFVGHATSFTPFLDDFGDFWTQWVADVPGPHVAIGHSMGGHLLLRALVEGIARPAAAVLVAPMLGLATPVGPRLGQRLATLMARMGDPARAAWRDNERPGTLSPRQSLLTQDPARYADELWWHDAKPELKLGPPSWAWLAEAFRSTNALAGDPRLATLDLPVLGLIADADKLVDPAAALRLLHRLPNGEIIRFGPESAHEILREADPVRDRAIGAIDAFLDRVTA